MLTCSATLTSIAFDQWGGRGAFSAGPKRRGRANQNAERLHGSLSPCHVQSSWLLNPIQPRSIALALPNTMERVSQRKTILTKLVQNQTLTSDGMDFLTLALDPFHDFDHPVAGYPDADCSATVVRCYQYAVDISKPAAAGAGSWNAHVFTLPFVQSTGDTNLMDSTITQPGVITMDAAAVTSTRGLLNWEINTAGQPLFPTSHANAIAATRTSGCVTVAPAALDGTCTRVIGTAFEIVDTTADMYRQGAITVYRQNQPPMSCDFAVVTEAAAAQYQSGDLRLIHAPPPTVEAAMLLPGSRQWAMREGAYVVCTQSTIDNPLATVGPKGCALVSGKQTVGSYAETQHKNSVIPAPASTFVPSGYLRGLSIPFNTSGVMLTGLNDNTTFRIKFKVYFEQAPLFYEPDTSVLATPSAPYDPTALEAYSKIMSKLPVGVYAGDNAAGDWFAAIASILSKVALPISTALAPVFPAAPLIGAGVTAAAEAARRAIVDGQKKNDMLVTRNKGQRNIEKSAKKKK